jgi:arginine repressor
LIQYSSRYDANIGIHALRRHVLNLTWKSYQESIPRILKHLRAKKIDAEKRIKEVDSQLNSLDSSKLRSIASNYVVNFLQVVERLIAGTSEGNPSVNGQTLEEEKNANGK